MKTPQILSTVIAFALLLSGSAVKAQMAMTSTGNYDAKEKINVNLKIAPSVKGFRAGISLMDSVQNKFRLWVSNSEERKFSVSVSGSSGNLWTNYFKDVYFNQVFDLSSLDDGEYFIRINCGNESFEKRIVLSTNSYVKRELKIE
jgi:hypothetical protein